MTTPKQRYLKDLTHEGFVADSAQEAAVDALEGLYERLVARQSTTQAGLLRGLVSRFYKPEQQPEIGLYFWGGVGRGKTYLMDNFYESLPFEKKDACSLSPLYAPRASGS